MKRKGQYAGGKNHYKRGKFTGGQSKLEAGMKGVLVSHARHKEKFCRLDSFKIFNHFAEQLYGPEKESDPPSDTECDDIEKSLSKEIDAIQDSCNIKNQEKRRFTAVQSGCNNQVFIRFKSGISPSVLVEKMVTCLLSPQRTHDENVPHVRNVLRVHPVEFSCPAYIDVMRKNIPPFLAKIFSELEHTVALKEFNITFKSRNNTHLEKESVKTDLYKDIEDSVPGWRFNCRTGSVMIIIDVLRAVSLVSVVKDYFLYKKYNVDQLLTQGDNAKQDLSASQVGEISSNEKVDASMVADATPSVGKVSTADVDKNLVSCAFNSKGDDALDDPVVISTDSKIIVQNNNSTDS